MGDLFLQHEFIYLFIYLLLLLLLLFIFILVAASQAHTKRGIVAIFCVDFFFSK